MESINYDDFLKLDLRVATILEATEVPKADKLLLLQLDIGNNEKRQIVAGIKKFYSTEELIGKQIVIVANLEPRSLKGIVSHGMLLAASNRDTITEFETEELQLLTTMKAIKAGSKVG